jgi:hypothetical protein
MTENQTNTGTPERATLPTPVLLLAEWLLPGLGYIARGQIARGLTIGITLLGLFIGGMWVGGMKVVVPFASYRPAQIGQEIREKPWFLAQVLMGPVAIVSGGLARDPGFVTSHARVNEIGTLYTVVAGLLNLLTLVDLSHRSGGREKA